MSGSAMSSTPRIPPPTLDGDAPSDAIGRSVLAHQPELLRAFLRAYGTLWSHGVVDQPTKEVARLRNARVTDCRYCRNVRFAASPGRGPERSTRRADRRRASRPRN